MGFNSGFKGLKFFSSTSSMKGKFLKIKKSHGVQTVNKNLNKLPF